MASKTWIGGVIGWFVLGPLGALIGAGIGHYMDKEQEENGDSSKADPRRSAGKLGLPTGARGVGALRLGAGGPQQLPHVDADTLVVYHQGRRKNHAL